MANDVKGGDLFWEIIANSKGFLRSVDNAVKGATKKLADLGPKVGLAMTAAGAVITGALGKAVSAAATFEQAITNAAAVTGKTGNEFEIAKKKMEALAQTLGQTTVFSATEAANAFFDLSSKGFDVASMSVAELQPILDLAAASQFDLATTTEIVTATLKGFGLANVETARIADVFTKANGSSAASMDKFSVAMPIVATAAKQLNVPLEEVTAILSSLFDKGIDASTSATALRNIMLELAVGSNGLNTLLSDLGLTLEDLDFENRTVAESFDFLSSKGATATQIMEAFGKRNGVVAASITEDIGKINGLTESLNNAGGAAKETAEKQLNTLQGQLKLLGSAIESVMIPIGQALIPALGAIARFIAPILGRIAEWAKANPMLTQTIIVIVGAVGALMLVLGPLLIALPGLIALFGAITSGGLVVAAAIAGVGVAIGAVVAVIASNWNEIIILTEDFFAIFSNLWEGNWIAAGNAFINIWLGVLNIFNNITNDILRMISFLVSKAAELPFLLAGIGSALLPGPLGSILSAGAGAGLLRGPAPALSGGGGAGGDRKSVV